MVARMEREPWPWGRQSRRVLGRDRETCSSVAWERGRRKGGGGIKSLALPLSGLGTPASSSHWQGSPIHTAPKVRILWHTTWERTVEKQTFLIPEIW